MKLLLIGENKLFLLYRAMVCAAIESAMVEEMVDGDLWSFTDCLDMSFEEIKNQPFELWDSIIQNELREFLGVRSH